MHPAQLGSQIGDQLDVFADGSVQHSGNAGHNLVEVNDRRSSTCFPLKASSCWVKAAARRAACLISCILVERLAGIHLSQRQIGVSEYRGEKVVEVVGSSASRPTASIFIACRS